MKKWLSLLLAACLMVSFFSCGKGDHIETTNEIRDEAPEINTDGFARVIESGATSLFVRGFTSVGYAKVSLPRGVDGEQFQVGDYVKITYSGICETYPLSASAAEIRRLTKKEIAAVYKEATVRGEYIGMNEKGIVLRHSGGTYIVPVDALDHAPIWEEGGIYEVRFDGTRFDKTLGTNDTIYFPISISRMEDDVILPGGTYRFSAEIRRITDTYLEVYTADENMRRISDLFHVSIPEGVDVSAFSVGDTVEITFAGVIEELYPANIKGTVSIALWCCGLTKTD